MPNDLNEPVTHLGATARAGPACDGVRHVAFQDAVFGARLVADLTLRALAIVFAALPAFATSRKIAAIPGPTCEVEELTPRRQRIPLAASARFANVVSTDLARVVPSYPRP